MSPAITRSSSYFVVHRLRGPAWNAALALREQVLWLEHAAFMDALTEEGFIVLGGPLGDTEGALLIIEAADKATVEARLAIDPWSKSGHLRSGSIHSWTILLDGQHSSR